MKSGGCLILATKGVTMDISNETKVIIHWHTKDEEAIRLIRERFGIPKYTTVNGYSPGVLKSEDREMFEETARRGYFSFMCVVWTYNGATYSW